jgi:hypothetical protein
MMRKALCIAVIALLGFGTLTAQGVRFGVKTGINLSKVKVDVIGNSDTRFGFNLGVFTEIDLSDKFILQPELLLSTQGGEFETSEDGNREAATLKINYLNIPLMVKYAVSDKIALEFGPQVGFLLSAKRESEITSNGTTVSENVDINEFYKSIDYGLNFGTSFNVVENIMIAARYNIGLSNIFEAEGDDIEVKNRVFSVSVGYRF